MEDTYSNERKKNISIWVTYLGEEHLIKTFPNEYRSLMMLIVDNLLVEDFGDCLGMGKCGTCLIKIDHIITELSFYERNEQTTISKTKIKDANCRLSCQIIINERLNGLKITVL
ncbi:2Fe-2S ferredoxin [Pedobacter sp. UYP24]